MFNAPAITAPVKPLPQSTADRIQAAGVQRIADHAAGTHRRPVLGCPQCG